MLTVTTMPSSTASGQFGSTVASTTAPAGTVGPAACACRATAQVTVASSASGRYAVRLSSVDSGRAGSFGQLTVGSFTDTGANGSTSAHSTARIPVSAANSTSGCRAGGDSAAGASGDSEGSDDSGRSVSGAEVTGASSRSPPTIRRRVGVRRVCARVSPRRPRRAHGARDGILDRRGGRRPAARGGRSPGQQHQVADAVARPRRPGHRGVRAARQRLSGDHRPQHLRRRVRLLRRLLVTRAGRGIRHVPAHRAGDRPAAAGAGPAARPAAGRAADGRCRWPPCWWCWSPPRRPGWPAPSADTA